MKFRLRLISCALMWALICPVWANALPANVEDSSISAPRRNPAFVVPPRLRPRVNFWKDIFSKYGKNQVVIHHRDYPQIVFAVLDFSKDAEELGPIALEKLKDQETSALMRKVEAALGKLGSGEAAESELEKDVERAMDVLPGGTIKYKLKLDDEMVRSQTGIREKFAAAVARAGRYLPFMEKVFVEDYGLPVEITRLPFIESSFDYMAYSSVGAAGIWQFMRRTAKIYMAVNNFVDERRDPIESTKAAARYLTSAYNTLGSWPLAITSYNHGVGGVAKAVRKIGTTNIATMVEHPTQRVFGFASTNFFPEFLAALEVYEEREKLFPEVVLEPPLEFDETRLTTAVSAARISSELKVPMDQLRAVNLALTDAVWAGRYKIPAGYNLKIPRGHQAYVKVLSEPEPSPTRAAEEPSPFVYYVKKGDTLSEISKKVGIPVPKLKAMNGLRNNIVKPGQKLSLDAGVQIRAEPATKSKKSSGKKKRR